MNCKFIKKDGTTCKGHPMKNNEFCYFHNSNTREQHKQSAQKGGKASTEQVLKQLEPIPAEDALSVLYLLTDTINRVRLAKTDGTFDLRTANCIGFLASKILEAKKLMIFEENILKRSILRNEKIDNTTFRKLMADYSEEILQKGNEVYQRVSKEYEEHKINKNSAYLF